MIVSSGVLVVEFVAVLAMTSLYGHLWALCRHSFGVTLVSDIKLARHTIKVPFKRPRGCKAASDAWQRRLNRLLMAFGSAWRVARLFELIEVSGDHLSLLVGFGLVKLCLNTLG